MKEQEGITLSIQNVRWRTIHGYAGVSNLLNNIPPDNFLSDLKSVCDDIKCIGKIDYNTHDGLIPFLSDLGDEDIRMLKLKYEKIENLLELISKTKSNDKNKNLLRKLLNEIKSAFDVIDTVSLR